MKSPRRFPPGSRPLSRRPDRPPYAALVSRSGSVALAFLAALSALGASACFSSAGAGPTGGVSGAGGDGVTGGASGTGGGTPGPATPVTVSLASLKPVAPTFRGQNYWSWVVKWGAQVDGTETLVAGLKLAVLRVGGTDNDTSANEAYSAAVVEKAVTYARAVGAEPIIQMPLIKDADGQKPATAASAANLLKYLNVTKSYGVKYVSIGNEPDLYTADQAPLPSFDAAKLCTQFAAFADALKAVDPAITIVGPDLSWKYVGGNDWLSPFLDGCASKVDVVALHRYPLGPTATTEAAAYADAAKFRGVITSVRALMKAHGAGDKPLAITEANITYDGDPGKTQLPASPGTLPAALWVADQIGVGMEEQLWSLDFWSLSEGWTLGFIDNGTPRPAFQALKLFGDHFGDQMATVSGAPSDVSVYASRRAGRSTTYVVAVNHAAADRTLTLNVTGGASPVAPVMVTVAATSLLAVELGDDGNAQLWRYGSTEAKGGKAPSPASP